MRVDHPKPQRTTQKHQQHDQPQGRTQSQEINRPRQDNYLQGAHNTTTYMNLPNSMQNKICGRCGSVGHIKRMCKEEVYCRYCKVYTNSGTACITYPVTSSRKNTPEKLTAEDNEREVSRRVQEEMKRILNDLSTSRRVASTQQILRTNQSSERKDVMNQALGQHVQNLIGDFQRPPEVSERVPHGISDQILNQQWDELPHMQPPMIPTTASTSQAQYTAMNTTSRQIEMPAERQQDNLTSERLWDRAAVAREKASIFTMHLQIETLQNEQQENRLIRGVTDQPFSGQESASTPTRHRQLDQMNGKQYTCSSQLTTGKSNQEGQASETGKSTPHTKDSVASEDKRTCDMKEGGRKGLQECKVIRILPDEELNFMDLVRDSVSAQARTGPKPMFVNNYFVGDNNWRTVAGEKPDAMRQPDESKNRSSIAVQTAVSLLGEENKPVRFVQMGISRMKAMSNNEGVYDAQSPLVVEPAKNGNSTGWSTNSFNLPGVHQNTPVRQQCKGLPDLTVPPPLIQDHTLPQGQSETNTSGRAENAILTVIERMTDTMEQQMRLSATRSEYNMQQNTKVMDQFIKAQDRRDLDPALMDIPTFTGEKPEKCFEWITCIKNVC